MMPPRKPSNDQVLVCPICGRFAVVDFAVAIASGWPRCCEVSMLLAGALEMDEQKVESVDLGGETLRVGPYQGGIVLQVVSDSAVVNLQMDIQIAKQLAAILFTLAEGLERVYPQEKN